MDLILASVLPHKKSLLNKLGLGFSIQKVEVDEKPKAKEKPEAFARRMALTKADILSKSKDVPAKSIILSHYMVIDIDGKIMLQPKDSKEAKKMLQKLSGKEHRIIGVVVLSKGGKELYQGVQDTTVKFKKLNNSIIDDYLKQEGAFDYVGGYTIQGDGGMFIESIEGSYFNAVGLPLNIIIKALEKQGFEVPDEVKNTVILQEKSIKESFPR